MKTRRSGRGELASTNGEMKPYIEAFRKVADGIAPSLAEQQIEVQVGFWLGSAVLKLQKRHWLDSKPEATPVDAGIFFSVWIDEKSLKRNRVSYNVHALRLRTLKRYALESREFAGAFRTKFASVSGRWPNVSVEFGPQTLMQGWIALDDERLTEEVAELASNFVPLGALIDRLLDQRKRNRRRSRADAAALS